ncbi:HotDog domain-containing protein, partial [Zopfochytrium polystomum]
VQVTPTMVNPGGTIHGGCLGTIIDVASTIAKLLIDVSQDREPLPGVSLSLGVTFVSAAKPGETLFVEVTVPKVGRQVFFTNTQLFAKEKDGSKGRLVAEGPHTKFVPPPPPAPKKSKI